MARFCITLPDEIHEKLKSGAKKQHISIAHYIRKLVEMGMELEALTDENTNGDGTKNSIFSEEKQRVLWRHLLTWSLESRTLIRGLFEKILESKLPNVIAEVQTVKEKAEARVLGLLEINED